jgi:hypothetical protein
MPFWSTTSGMNMNLRFAVHAAVVAQPSEAIWVMVQLAGAFEPMVMR